MSTVAFRAAQPSDSGFAFEVAEAAMRGYVEQTWGEWEPNFQREHHARSFKTESHQVILVDDEPAGILAVEMSMAHVQLEKLYLLPPFRNQGVGSRVLRSVLDAAAAAHKPVRLRTLAVNTAARRFYARHGFVVTGATPERVFMQAGAPGPQAQLHAPAGTAHRTRIVALDHRTPATAQRIHAVQRLAYAQEAALLNATHFAPLDRTPADVLSSAERYLGALLADELVGAVSIETDLRAQRMTIASLVVTPMHQRKGIGRLLLAAALHECRGSTVTVSTGAKNAPALALYGSFGFVERGRRTVGPEALSVIELRRPEPGPPLRPIAPGGH